jgi:hypothetical protein
MDFMVMQTGTGVNFNLKTRLDELGSSVWINPFTNNLFDVQATMESALSRNSEEPIRLVIDSDGADAVALADKIFSILRYRVVAGYELPQGSSIILTIGSEILRQEAAVFLARLDKFAVIDIREKPEEKTILDEARGISDAHEKILNGMVSMIRDSYGPDFKPKTHAIVSPEALGVGADFSGGGKTKVMEAMTKGMKVHIVRRDRAAEDENGKGL